ncbi:MAG: hypothetical protein Q8N23_06215 [Archangium sp.]|nr:hypothetical protein [Archangium sp.]MDP3571091.1 hypothetical protein [Archangium sp.]
MSIAEAMGNEELGLLALWVKQLGGTDVEYSRVLAIYCEKIDSPIASACRLWLAENTASDLGVVHTLLGHIRRTVAATGRWPALMVGHLGFFLSRAFDHPEVSVRAEALAIVHVGARRNILSELLYKGGLEAFLRQVRSSTQPFVDEEEALRLSFVEEYLASAQIPISPSQNPRALQRLALDLLDLEDLHPDVLRWIEELLAAVRERSLLEDAGARSGQTERPIQTIRVKAATAAARLVRSVVEFCETVVATVRDPDFVEDEAPDFGLELGWATAASVPIHLTFTADDARPAFELLERLVKISNTRGQFESEIGDLPPTSVAAYVRLLQRTRLHKESVEIILTDPSSSMWQRRIVVSPHLLANTSTAVLMKEGRGARRANKSIYLAAEHVPQANTVRQVFQAVDAILRKGDATYDDIDEINSNRQVNYYKQGARVLDFLDADNQPTARARTLIGVSHERRLELTALYFEDSLIGRAWRTWSGVNRLTEIDPETATQFISDCVRGLGGTTPGRRASTLKTWHAELMPHYLSGRAGKK